MVWDKPIGEGYSASVVVKDVDVIVWSFDTVLGYGPVGFLIIPGLQPAKKYTIALTHQCTTSQAAPTALATSPDTVTMFGKGTFKPKECYGLVDEITTN